MIKETRVCKPIVAGARDAYRPHDPATRRVLLGSEYILDARPSPTWKLALQASGFLQE